MLKKNRTNIKNLKRELATENINYFFQLLNKNDLKEFHKDYIKQILKLAHSFNIRLTREEKLKFCKKCFAKWPENCTIRINKNTKCVEYTCKNCGYIKRIRYKK